MSVFKIYKLLLLALLLASNSTTCWAWPPTYGPEFTFSSQEIYKDFMKNPKKPDTDENLKALERWKKGIEDSCSYCVITSFRDKHGLAYRIQKGELEFNISLDNGVIEVQMPPATREQARANKDFIQKEIFDSAAKIGLKPEKKLGGGHIHIGYAEAFGNDPLLFRDFLVDFANNPDMANGIFSDSIENAPPIISLGEKNRQAFIETIEDFDRKPRSGEALARTIAAKVYTNTTKFTSPKHYQALKLERIHNAKFKNQKTLEIRSFRPQQSAEQYLVEIELLEERLKYLKRWGGKIPIDLPHNLSEAKDKVTKFYIYTQEMGFPWERAINILPEGLQKIRPNIRLGNKVVAARKELLNKMEVQIALEKSLKLSLKPSMRDHCGNLFRRLWQALP